MGSNSGDAAIIPARFDDVAREQKDFVNLAILDYLYSRQLLNDTQQVLISGQRRMNECRNINQQ